MFEESDLEELQVEVENDELAYVEFDISSTPSDPQLEQLVTQLENKDILIPFYQRRYVWKIDQASRLIESFLMGLPVPQIFLYVNDDNQLEVIDGQQRIMSVKYFMEGYFGEADARGRRTEFKLKLAEQSPFNNKRFVDLAPKDQRKLRLSTLRAINVKQLHPSKRNDSVFHIFERLNTGGTRLKSQEIRNAVYRGRIVGELQRLNESSSWRRILGIKTPDKNQRDVEIVLRLFSLFENWGNYEKPMLHFLNGSMKENSDFSSVRSARFTERFPQVVDFVNSVIAKPFRPKGVLNTATLEAVIIALMELPDISHDALSERYLMLISDGEFEELTKGPTTDTNVLKGRIAMAKKVLGD
ncbi:DUF262 domain-containing protein [Pseudomonas lalucatii]|uniref:DUF262 domain-containing protein n=1 Tax=Pseudomonas lalucatii TaxID=1424203 RepID=A0ABS5PVW3_9PSED|nr:DUF262 domain-containing protein [Pseudomonas lalucatii]MBS7660534.1 DUF262 domain-containing protein [Pseudomonas lalucatii]